MIWIFDSGFGGLQSLKYFRQICPEYDYLYFADSGNAPYGNKSNEEIKELTYKWLNYLFENWAKIVILACNTASACAIRSWQNEFPEKKVLSVSIPWIEKIIESKASNICVLATPQTIKSGFYINKLQELEPEIPYCIYNIPALELVEIIESWNVDNLLINKILMSKLWNLPFDCTTFVLWCTHYPIVLDNIVKCLNPNISIINPSWEAAKKFSQYLNNHENIKNKLLKNSTVNIVTSWDLGKFKTIANKIINWEFNVNNYSNINS